MWWPVCGGTNTWLHMSYVMLCYTHKSVKILHKNLATCMLQLLLLELHFSNLVTCMLQFNSVLDLILNHAFSPIEVGI